MTQHLRLQVSDGLPEAADAESDAIPHSIDSGQLSEAEFLKLRWPDLSDETLAVVLKLFAEMSGRRTWESLT